MELCLFLHLNIIVDNYKIMFECQNNKFKHSVWICHDFDMMQTTIQIGAMITFIKFFVSCKITKM